MAAQMAASIFEAKVPTSASPQAASIPDLRKDPQGPTNVGNPYTTLKKLEVLGLLKEKTVGVPGYSEKHRMVSLSMLLNMAFGSDAGQPIVGLNGERTYFQGDQNGNQLNIYLGQYAQYGTNDKITFGLTVGYSQPTTYGIIVQHTFPKSLSATYLNGDGELYVDYDQIMGYFKQLWSPDTGHFVSGTTYDDLLMALAARESSNQADAVSKYHYMGLWQIGYQGLQDIGWVDTTIGNRKWIGESSDWDMNSETDFLTNPEAQRAAIEEYHKNMWSYVTELDLDRFIGQTISGIKITASGLLMGAHLVGQDALRQALEAGDLYSEKDGLGTNAAEYIRKFSGYDIPWAN